MKRESESVEMGLSEANISLGEPALPEGQIKEPTGHLVPQASELMATIEKTPCAVCSSGSDRNHTCRISDLLGWEGLKCVFIEVI